MSNLSTLSYLHEDLPSVSEDALVGAPPSTWHDFKHAKLRQHPQSGSRIKWGKYVGHGIQGVVYRARIDGGDPVAIKVFWLSRRPEPLRRQDGTIRILVREWPFEEEARTVAVLEKLRWSMASAEGDPTQSILLRKPENIKRTIHVRKSVRAFTNEAKARKPREDRVSPPPFPPLPKCHGWLRVRKEDVPDAKWTGEEMNEDMDWHWAIVYDLVPRKPLDLAVAKLHLDFFHALGFSLVGHNPRKLGRG